MALLEVNWNPDRRQLKQFAAIWIGFFGLFGLICLLRKGSLPVALAFWVVAAFGLVEFLRSGSLRRVYVGWMCLALPIGWVVSHALLAGVYYLVLTPIGLVMRLFGYDPMQSRFDRQAESYWTPHDPGGESARYFKQF